MTIRGIVYGGTKPLFCVPLVAEDTANLLAQAKVAHDLAPDLVEWRADSIKEVSPSSYVDSLNKLRSVLKHEPIIFTLRVSAEGGAQDIAQETRRICIESVAATGLIDILDTELRNEKSFLDPVLDVGRKHGARVILSYHNFEDTPPNEELLGKIRMMNQLGADIAKIAVMPRAAGDVLRLLEVTLEARESFPRMPLVTMSMGRLGALTRIAGFLFGSDMAYAVGQETSAPGQIAIAEARLLTEKLLGFSMPDPQKT